MRDNIEEARKLESQYHNEANQQANVAGGELIPDNFVDESEKLPLKEIGAHLPVVEKAETRQAAPTMPANVENVSSRQATTVEVLGTATEGKDNEVKVIVLLPKGMRRDEVQPTQSGVNSGLSKNGFGRREDNQQVIIIEDGNVNEVRIQIKAFEDEWARRGIKGRAVVFAQQNENGTINTAGDLQKEYPTDQGNVTVIPDAYLDFNPEKNAYPDIILRVAIGRIVAFYYTGNDPTGTLAVINSLLAKVADGQPPITTINDLLNLLRPLRIRPIIYKEITDWQRAQKATATSL
jgi:hypothetical protein